MPQKLSREEALLKKKIAERIRYSKIKENSILYEEQKEKEKKKYLKKKEKGLVKPVNELTPRQQRLKRKQWRKSNQIYYKRKKNAKNLENFLRESSPPASDGPVLNSPQITSSAKRGRKKLRRDRSKVVRENLRLKERNEKLKRSLEKYRKRLQRYKAAKNISDSPGTKIKELLKDKTKQDEVAKRLIFNEIIITEIKKVEPSKKRKLFRQSFNKQVPAFKKYKILHKLKPFFDPRTICKNPNLFQSEKCNLIFLLLFAFHYFVKLFEINL